MQEEANDDIEYILPNISKKNYTSSDSKVKPLKTLVLIYLEKKNQDLEQEKEKERFYKNKCLIEELADRARRIQREKWCLAKYKPKERHKNLTAELGKADIVELNNLDNIKNHKKLKLDCSFLYNENARLKAEIERLKYRNEKYRKKVYKVSKVRGEKKGEQKTENYI